MSDNVSIALVAAVSAIVGGLITSVLSPYIKDRLFTRASETNRKRELIADWRKMLLEVEATAESSDKTIGHLLQLHPKFSALEPHLTEEGRSIVYRRNFTASSSALSHPTLVLMEEIARIEKLWELQK